MRNSREVYSSVVTSWRSFVLVVVIYLIRDYNECSIAGVHSLANVSEPPIGLRRN